MTDISTGSTATCRYCGHEIVYGPWFLDGRGPNPPVWSHTHSGVKSCSTRPVGWGADSWPFATPAAQDSDEATTVRDAARQAAGQQKPPVGYGDGKGRVYCLRCANAVAAEVPLTVDIVDHWELCPSCGRHVVDVANNQAAGQTPTTEHLCVCDDSPEECAAVGEPDACPTPETHNWGCGCPTDELPAAKAREALAGYMGGRNNDPALASLLNDYHLAVAEAARAGATAPVVGQPAEAQPADRAAILREAADIAEQVAMRLQDHGDPTQSIGAYEVMSDLRRMADEETH